MLVLLHIGRYTFMTNLVEDDVIVKLFTLLSLYDIRRALPYIKDGQHGTQKMKFMFSEVIYAPKHIRVTSDSAYLPHADRRDAKRVTCQGTAKPQFRPFDRFSIFCL